MSFLIYCETNWIVGSALGQDPEAEELLSSSHLELAVPGVCFMEAISAFDWKRIERNELTSELDRQLAQVRRSREIPMAQQLAGELIQAKLTNDKLLNDVFQRLDDLLVRLARRATILPVSVHTIDRMLELRHTTELDRDDALILASIFTDLRPNLPRNRAFLTGNIHDFGTEAVRSRLEAVGIKLFSSTRGVLQWSSGAP